MKNLKLSLATKTKISAYVLAGTMLGTMFIASCSKNKKGDSSNIPEDTAPVATASYVKAGIPPLVTAIPGAFGEQEVDTTEPKIYTTEEKIAFVNENWEKFMTEVNNIPGIQLDGNAAKLQLGFINGLSPEQTEVSTNDFVLDFITDYTNIWNVFTVGTMNYLVNGISLTENNSLYGNIYGNYILDEEDKKAYEYFANKTLNIVNLAYEGKNISAVEEATVKNKINAEKLVLDGLFEGTDIDNISEEIQYMIRNIAFLDTHFLPERTAITIDTVVGEQNFINYDDSVAPSNYSYDDGTYIVTGNIQNDISYYIGRDSVNATMKYWVDPSWCSYNSNDSETHFKAKVLV